MSRRDSPCPTPRDPQREHSPAHLHLKLQKHEELFLSFQGTNLVIVSIAATGSGHAFPELLSLPLSNHQGCVYPAREETQQNRAPRHMASLVSSHWFHSCHQCLLNTKTAVTACQLTALPAFQPHHSATMALLPKQTPERGTLMLKNIQRIQSLRTHH